MELFFGKRRAQSAVGFWVGEGLTGRLQMHAKSSEMQDFISRARHQITEAFNDLVADSVEGPDRVVLRRVKKADGLRLLDENGRDIGDIDVLVADTQAKLLFVLETKDFETARTPWELGGEIKKIFGAQKGTVVLHKRRVAWVERNMDRVLAAMRISETPNRGQWQVRAAIVVSELLLSPLVVESDLPVVPIAEIESLFHLEKPSRRRRRR